MFSQHKENLARNAYRGQHNLNIRCPHDRERDVFGVAGAIDTDKIDIFVVDNSACRTIIPDRNWHARFETGVQNVVVAAVYECADVRPVVTRGIDFMNVLITGSRAPVALELARQFHARGHQVFQADSLSSAMAMRSAAVIRSEIVPRPADDVDAYLDAIAKLISEERIDLLVPTCEEVFFLAHGADRLDCHCFFDDFEKLAKLHNKLTFSTFASNQFVAVPETRLLNDFEGFLKEDDPKDWVFKPAYSRFASRTLISPGHRQLRRIDPAAEQWIAQRRITGKEYSTYSAAVDGHMIAHCTYHSLYRAGTGSGICFEPVELPDVESFVAEFVRQNNYTGQIGFDIISDADGLLWVLEANPRATSGLQLFTVGDGLVDRMISACTERDDESATPIRPSQSSPAMIEFAMPVWGLLDAISRGRLLQFPGDLMRSRWLCWSAADMWPMLGLPISFWELIRIAWQKKCSLHQASTFDIEWNGERL